MSARNCLSLEQKLLIINEVEKGEKKKKDIAAQFGMPSSSLSTILKNKAELFRTAEYENINSKRKRIRKCLLENGDDSMLKWTIATREKNLPLPGPLMRVKVKEFANALGQSELDKRRGIVEKTLCGESAHVNIHDDEWFAKNLPNLIKGYDKNEIFNADETGIFFKCLPNKTLAFKNEKCFGGKRSKERITLMLACNMTGSEKLKLLVIGKSKNPRCFKGIKSLNVDYEFNKKAWMTSEIYMKWLLKLDKMFISQNRKVLLFVDNCTAHPKIVKDKLRNIELAYFPPNMTSLLKPMDQGIIQNLKQHYRKQILMQMLSKMEEKKPQSINLYDAIQELNKVWNVHVKAETIANCFRKAGFLNDVMQTQRNSCDVEDCVPISGLRALWSSYSALVKTEALVEEYLNIDNEVCTMGTPSDEEILQDVIENLEAPDISDSDEDEDDPNAIVTDKPTMQQASSAVKVIRNFVERKNDVNEHVFASLNVLEVFIEEEKWKKNKQTKITDYFK